MTHRPALQPDTLLPPLYGRWITRLLNDRIPDETLATCHDCAMCCADTRERKRHLNYFDPSSKCCTYTPSLPNFLVGSILLDPDVDPAGRRSVVDRLRNRVGVNPLGMDVSPDYSLRYASMASEAFGQATAMRCPHYLDRDGGLCGIWRHRNSICSTWFCKFVRGGVGMAFWNSTRELLHNVEKSVSLWAVCQLGGNVEILRQAVEDLNEEQKELSRFDLAGTVDFEAYQRVWGPWSGREAEFFRRCSQLVAALEWNEVERIGGAILQAHARLVLDDFGRLLQRTVPAALELGHCELLSAESGKLQINGYSPGDPLELSPALMKVLPYFDGSPTEDILVRIARQERIEIDRDLLLRLLDYGLVKECKQEQPALASKAKRRSRQRRLPTVE